jgi:GR25 family glycosyltransferase involved in LPS biosynthesis
MKQKSGEFKIKNLIIAMACILFAYLFFVKVVKVEGMSSKIKRSDFDCYVINLDKNEDRLQKFTSSYSSTGLKDDPFIRVKAIYGKDINYESYISENVEIKMTPGMVGCFLSHLQTYDMILKSNKDYALIFEDDASITEPLDTNVVSNIFDSVPSDWDIILLGYDLSNRVHRYEKMDGYLKVYNFWGTHAYFIKREAIIKFLDFAKPPFTNQIDFMMGDLCKKGLLNVYAIPNRIVFQDARYTDVQVF